MPPWRASELGLASGLLNSAQQVGSALWVAVLTVVAVAATGALESAGAGHGEALVGGFTWAFVAGSGLVVLSLLGTLLVVRRDGY